MSDPLQFDKAEYAGSAALSGCTQCQQPLGGQYYELNGAAICGSCKASLDAARSGGSGLGRFVKSTTLGLLTAALGTAIWYGVRALTGYEFGLLAILVGLGVGGAVRAGSNARGGWAYQTLAMFLTYASIVGTYVPEIWKALDQPPPTESALAAAAPAPSGVTAPANPRATPAPADPGATPAPAGAESSEPAPVGPAQGLAALALAVLFLMALAFAAPFLAGFENIMGLIIIGIGLYEAWKMNRASPVGITGPYRLALKGPTAGA